MSLIKKADVKNHLSARHRSEIHLARPGNQSDATGIAPEDSADPKVNASVKKSSNRPSAAGTTAAVTSKSVKE